MDSKIVTNVQTRAAKLMARVRPCAPYGLADLALSCPSGVNGYGYDVERSSDWATVGCLVGDRSWRKRDPVAEYCLVELSDGTRFEFEQLRADPDRVEIRQNGDVLGQSRVIAADRFLRMSYPTKWELRQGDKVFGVVERGACVSRDSLCVRCIGRPDLQLILAQEGGLMEVLKCIGRLVSLSFLFMPLPPNRDLVIPADTAQLLRPHEVTFFFAVALLFRAVYFKLEFGG